MPSSKELGNQLEDLDLTSEQRASAARTVASAARDAEDCGLLLDILGLSAEEAQDSRMSRRISAAAG